jgi:hypothetical protein
MISVLTRMSHGMRRRLCVLDIQDSCFSFHQSRERLRARLLLSKVHLIRDLLREMVEDLYRLLKKVIQRGRSRKRTGGVAAALR